jgi:hypothetical protein
MAADPNDETMTEKPVPVRSVFLLGLVIWIGVCVTFLSAIGNSFVNYDDDIYVTANVHVLTGLTPHNIAWAFHSIGAASNWHPITWLSHMVDCQVFGTRSWGHHLTSVLLHATNAALLFVLLNAATRSMSRSFCAAALFGVHPLRVESVAWVAERKDLLSGFFFFLALWSYATWVRQQTHKPASGQATASEAKAIRSFGNKWYVYTLIFFSLGLMSKPIVVTLPFILLLLDYWPFQRLHAHGLAGLCLEKIPFFALAGAACVVTYVAQSTGGAMSLHLPFASRAANAVVSYVRYLSKFFWPAHLSVFYPLPESWPKAIVVFSLLALAICTGLMLLLARRHRSVLVGWLWFLGTLVPVLGLVQVGEQAMADRYTYLPSIGLCLMLCWGIPALFPAWPRFRKPVIVLTGAVVVLCSAATVRQIRFWKSSEGLFGHALALELDGAEQPRRSSGS